MSVYFSKTVSLPRQMLVVLLVVALVVPVMPAQFAYAEEVPPEETEVTGGDTGTTTEEIVTEENEEESTDGENGTSTENGENGTSTEDGTDGGSEETQEETATTTEEVTSTSTEETTETETGTTTEDTGTTTENTGTTTEETATTTDEGPGDEGDTGGGGTDGSEGGDGDPGNDAEANPGDGKEPVPVISETEIGDEGTPEDGEEVTGGVSESGSNITINTGPASAQGELFSDANSNNVRSEIGTSTIGDLDVYTFNATGTNEANVDNTGGAFAMTGDNKADSSGVADIRTGDAIAAFNVANVVNSNVVNSDGFLYLKNTLLEEDQSLDLRGLFFPDEGSVLDGANDCDLLSCVAEDIVYNFSASNLARITNDVTIEAITGENDADGDFAQVKTGDAYGGANVINVVNSNIIDSNYRLLAFNAIGDLEGDLMLPREDLLHAFFSTPNGLSRVVDGEGPESATILAESVNNADVNNNVFAYAETGLNNSYTTLDSLITTGRAESESNIHNKINENIFGGDNMFLHIRIHGYWDGDVHGLPEGLTWDWTPDGIIIYNPDAEISPSQILPYDADTYTANFTNQNDLVIDNNINIDAISGDNKVDGLLGEIETGNAFASANVINIANTNFIGTNWAMAVINIFGDFDGDVTFTETDLSLTGTQNALDDPLAPGSDIDYTYTVSNNGDVTANNVVLKQTLSKAYATGTDNVQTVAIGSILPGQSKNVNLTAFVNPALPLGTHTVSAVASVESDEADGDESNNVVVLSKTVVHEEEEGEETGTSTDDGTGSSTDDGTGTTTDDGTGDDAEEETNETPAPAPTPTPSPGGGCGSCGGGGGGGPSNDDDDEEEKLVTTDVELERTQIEVDPTDPPHITILKEADISEGDVIVAGKEVSYTITVINQGGGAYDAVVYDTLTNPIGSVVTEQSWELGTILPGETIKLSYTTAYSKKTPSGTYTNTAHIEAYRYPDDKKADKEPLKLSDAKHVIKIDGVDLGIGNIDIIAYFPTSSGGTGALVSWETSKPSVSKVLYSRQGLFSPYDPNRYNFGYESASFMFPDLKTKHFMILLGLRDGMSYLYRIHANDGEHTALSSENTFAVPPRVTQLTLAFPLAPASQVAGASSATPAPSAPEPQPAPSVVTPPVTVPKTEPEPEPEPETEPEPESEHEQQGETGGGLGGIVKKAASKLFSIF